MKVIGITGPTGAGKTTALNALRDLGAQVIDADAVYHQLLRDSAPMKGTLVAAFGLGILGMDDEIDRKKLAEAVYPDGLELLSQLTHPFVVQAIDDLLGLCAISGQSCTAIDAIALIESGLGDRCDAVVTVTAPLETRIRRIMARDSIDEAYARRRALAQKPDEFFRDHSDYVLENTDDDTPEAFGVRAGDLFRTILEEN